MSVSAQLIVMDEEEMIGQCLSNLESFDNLDEICITDSGSTDRTHDIISDFLKRTTKRVIYTNRRFDHFHKQRNWNQKQSGCDWILRIDADETISQGLDEVLFKIEDLAKGFSGVSFNQIEMFGDYFHRQKEIGRSLMMWRNGGVFFKEENPFGQITREGIEISATHEKCLCLTDVGITNVVKKQHCLLKSDNGLLKKWDNYKETDDMKDPNFEAFTFGREHWLNCKKSSPVVFELEKEWYDDVTNGKG